MTAWLLTARQKMTDMWRLAAKLTQKLPAEMAHNVAVFALAHGFAPIADQILLPVKIAGLQFDNPVGLAAGFDKNAAAVPGAHRLGFGFTEVGTITPKPQPGNPKPRVFRLAEDQAVINRYGFNSKGMQVARKNLEKISYRTGIVGVNIGANKESEDRVADYYKAAQFLAGQADYLTVNISSPNTPGLRDLQADQQMKEVLNAAFSGRNDGISEKAKRPPIFVKLAPDMSMDALFSAVDTGLECQVNGFILSNTTIARPKGLNSAHRHEAGGLSGQPLSDKALSILSAASGYLQKQGCTDIALIGVGGIANASQAYARLLAGADLVQLYTALALNGPHMVGTVLSELRALLIADGVTDIRELKHAQYSANEAVKHAEHIAKIAEVPSKNS
jgi:dihydroorotate dehydrogenase